MLCLYWLYLIQYQEIVSKRSSKLCLSYCFACLIPKLILYMCGQSFLSQLTKLPFPRTTFAWPFDSCIFYIRIIIFCLPESPDSQIQLLIFNIIKGNVEMCISFYYVNSEQPILLVGTIPTEYLVPEFYFLFELNLSLRNTLLDLNALFETILSRPYS